MMGNVKLKGYIILILLFVLCPIAAAEDELVVLNVTPEVAAATMPVLFAENQGQFDDNVSYQAGSSEQVISVLTNGVEFSQSPGNSSVLMTMQNSNPDAKIVALDPVNGTANYLYGTDPSAWVSDVPLSAGVLYEDAYPGINMTLSGTDGLLKTEFIVRPEGDPASIILSYQGQTGLSINATTGDLVIETPAREITDEAPFAYQMINGTKQEVDCNYVLNLDGTVTFKLGDFDKTIDLVIDPVLRYSLYFGGSGRDWGNSIAVDNNGYAYFIGTTWSDHLKAFDSIKEDTKKSGDVTAMGLAPGSVQPYFGGGEKDAFVIKIDPDGTDLEYITYIGGSGTDEGTGLVIDDKGNAYVVGGTSSPDFPVKNGYRDKISGTYDAWVAKLQPDGQDFVFSTYLGGELDDFANAVAIDKENNIFVTGQTHSWNFPVVNRYQLSPFGGMTDAFITKLDKTGKSIVYSNFIGGSAYDSGSSITIDPNGYACIVGQTESFDFPMIKPYMDKFHGPFDVFVTKFDPEGKYPAAYSTYLGGSQEDDGRGILALADGRLVVVGSTKSPDFPTVKPFQNSRLGLQSGFMSILNADGSALDVSTYFGGSLNDLISGVAKDASGNIYVVGTTNSVDLPVKSAYQSKHAGASDAMVAKFTPDLSDTVYVTYLGGQQNDEGRAIAITDEGDAYIVGYTESKTFPKVWPYQQNYGSGDRDAFVVVLSPHDMIPVTDFVGVPTTGDAPLTVQFTDKSLGIPTSWEWSFGDGASSTEKNPKHVYEKPGIYTVSLTAKNIVSSQTKTKENYITVLDPVQPPVADFSAVPQAGMVPLTVTFTDLTTNKPDAWAWDFGDGAVSTEKNPVHCYDTPGKYTVKLNASNRAGNSTKEKVEFIDAQPSVVKPIADFSADPTSGTAPLNVKFTDLSQNAPVIWMWDFGDGCNSEESNPTHIYENAGTYSVSLTVTNAAGTDTKVKSEFITVGPGILPPVADFTGEPRSGVAPLKVVFTDKSLNNPETWMWNFGDGESANERNPTHVYAKPGTYTVTLTVTNLAGTDTKVEQNYVTAKSSTLPPVADFTANPTSGMAPLTVTFIDLSKNGPTQWYWNFGDGSESMEQNPVHEYVTPGSYTVELTVSNEAGADTKVAKEFIFVSPRGNPPDAQFRASPTSGTAPLAVSFTDLSSGTPTSWEWQFGDGQSSTEQHPQTTYVKPGDYTVSLFVKNEFGTSQKVRENYIHVAEKPPALKAGFMGQPTSGDAPLTVQFTDLSSGNPTGWIWNFGDGQTSSDMNPVHTYQKAGLYTVFLTVTRGEEKASEIRYEYICVNEPGKPPVADFVATPTTGNAPLTVSFTDLSRENPTEWKWDFGDGEFSSQQHPTHVFAKPGTYTVCLEASNQFGSAKACKQNLVTVVEPPQEPAGFFGHITVNGEAACIGTQVEARGVGVAPDVFNPVTMSIEGNYGTPDMLTVKGDVKNGEMLTFWVKDPSSNEFIQAECYDVYGGSDWTTSYPFRAGEKTRLDLRIGDAPIPPMPVLPHEFYGEVTTSSGSPAEPGTIIIVRGDNVLEGHRGNPLPITSSGVYGFGELQKLVAQGDLTQGQPLTFWVIPCGSNEAVPAEVRDVDSSSNYASSIPYNEGGLTRLDIRIAGGSPVPSPTQKPGPVPGVPMIVSGTVTLDDIPVVAGSLIDADGEGVDRKFDGNPVSISDGGCFDALSVQGDIIPGSAIYFTLFDAQTAKEYSLEVKDPVTGNWMPSYPFESKDISLELRATSVVPMDNKSVALMATE